MFRECLAANAASSAARSLASLAAECDCSCQQNSIGTSRFAWAGSLLARRAKSGVDRATVNCESSRTKFNQEEPVYFHLVSQICGKGQALFGMILSDSPLDSRFTVALSALLLALLADRLIAR